MSACSDVSRWITENVVVPVDGAFTTARESCSRVGSWVEILVWQPVEQWLSQTERRCREQECEWWCLCCNKWLCWIVTLVVRVVVWIGVTVGKWVVEIVCEVVTAVVALVVNLIIAVLSFVVQLFVCLLSDPAQLGYVLLELWDGIVNAIGSVLDLVVTLIDDVAGILEDVGRLVDGVGNSLCSLGDLWCDLGSLLFGLIGSIVDWVGEIVDWVRGTVDGLKDLIAGILTFNWCQIQRGLRVLNVLRVVISVVRIPAGVLYGGLERGVKKANVGRIIDAALVDAFGDSPGRLEEARLEARIGGSPVGVPVRLLPTRMAIPSGPSLASFVASGVIDLHAIAGTASDCSGAFVTAANEGEVVYTGTSTRVSRRHLDEFLRLGASAVPSFTVYPIRIDVFRRYLDTARRKAFEVGLNLTWASIAELPVSLPTNVPLSVPVNPVTGALDTSVQERLLSVLGRSETDENLKEIPVVAVFGYTIATLNGLASYVRGPQGRGPSGITFRARFPEEGYRYVPIHEMGHYAGLDHEGHESAKYIMWSPGDATDWGAAIAELAFLSGEPIFTEGDAEAVWRWITTTPQARDSILFP